MTTTTSYVRLDALRPHEGNAKEHDVEALVQLIDKLGFIGSIDVDDRTERVLGGHGRWHALVQMRAGNYKTPRGILTDDDGEWLVPVSRGWSSRNREEATAANVALNRAQELAGYDQRALAAQIEEIQGHDAALFDSLAFTDDEMDAMLRFTPEPEDPDAPTGAVTTFTDLDDDSDVEPDPATAGPDGGKKVTCPGCGHRFHPGDKEVW